MSLCENFRCSFSCKKCCYKPELFPIWTPSVPGIQGSPGAQGIPGPQGAPGAQGPPGPGGGSQGAPGIQGNVGDQGAPGIQGNVGDQGAPGIQGNVGDQGSPGIQGNVGDQGAPGIQGNVGDQGAPGIQGAPGANLGYITIYTETTTVTYLNNQPVFFNFIVTPTSPVFSFTPVATAITINQSGIYSVNYIITPFNATGFGIRVNGSTVILQSRMSVTIGGLPIVSFFTTPFNAGDRIELINLGGPTNLTNLAGPGVTMTAIMTLIKIM